MGTAASIEDEVRKKKPLKPKLLKETIDPLSGKEVLGSVSDLNSPEENGEEDEDREGEGESSPFASPVPISRRTTRLKSMRASENKDIINIQKLIGEEVEKPMDCSDLPDLESALKEVIAFRLAVKEVKEYLDSENSRRT